ncbi:MAG TPA: hypothetical protein VMT72_10350 [Pseudolabrys sp.]|nr:hypothetical protein [Pseudolabrys sp.]
MILTDLPMKISRADTDGINNALEAVVMDQVSGNSLAALLQEDPIGVIRRCLHLNRYQRAGLAEMTKDEITQLIAPLLKVLKSRDPAQLRGLRLVEEVVRQSPVKIKCHIEIDW